MRDIKSFLANLSHHPGVYQMLGEGGEILYVGKAKDLKKRVASYFNKRVNDLKTASLVKKIKDIDVIVAHSENEAVLLECNLIKKHMPRYNVLLRDDKSYPYILITTEHPFPKIELYRGARKRSGLFFGPYSNAVAARETINILQKIFRLRTCRDNYYDARSKPCLLYQIGRCAGPCVGLVSKEEYDANIKLAILFLKGKNNEIIHELQARMEVASNELHFELAAHYRDQIGRLRQIQDRQYVNVRDGDADAIGLVEQSGITCIQVLSIRGGQTLGSRSYFPTIPPHSTKQEIINAFLTQFYLNQATAEGIPRHIVLDFILQENDLIERVLSERAQHSVQLICPARGEKKKWLTMATMSAKQSLTARLYNKINMSERMLALQETFQLKALPQRIECFDISHSMGEATVASCVVFDRNGPVKSDYRRFNISGITPGDDVAAMHQVLHRRFSRLQREGARLPDIIFIDGGKTQLGAARTALESLNIKDVLMIGVSKGPERKPGFETLHREGTVPTHLVPDSLALHLIQQIRDEAHRFAITGHRQRRDKTRRQSSLEWIPGIGTKRRRELLRYFGGIQGISHASLDELSKVPGISRSLAERL